jgi:hypothetical protein
VNAETTLPASIAAEYVAQFNQMDQPWTTMKVVVCRLCGGICRLDRDGTDPRPTAGCIITAEYADEHDRCSACREFYNPDRFVSQDSASNVRDDAWTWASAVARFQARIAEARVAKVEVQLQAEIEARREHIAEVSERLQDQLNELKQFVRDNVRNTADQ